MVISKCINTFFGKQHQHCSFDTPKFLLLPCLCAIEWKQACTILVPSGNFGNLTAGLFAKKWRCSSLCATNQNKIVPDYLNNGIFEPKASVQTISNAMDVGNPSNFMRMMDFYPEVDAMKKILSVTLLLMMKPKLKCWTLLINTNT